MQTFSCKKIIFLHSPTLQIIMNVLLTMVDVIRYVSTQYLVTGVTAMMHILLIMTILLVYVMLTVQREHVYVWMALWTTEQVEIKVAVAVVTL